jgi:hypothetical protein
MYSQQNNRHIAAYISPYSINYMHLRNPWISAWWSAAFPGFGQIMMCKYVVGFILIGWEIFINQQSHLNSAIFLSMLGKFEQAKDVLDKRWLLVYIPIYVFGIWDAYTRTVKYESDYILSYKKGFQIISKNIDTFELNKLQKKSPFLALLWSFFTPGLGYLYINRIVSIFIFSTWFIVISYYSKLYLAFHNTMLGNFEAAIKVTDPQWLLYLPSLYVFAIYDSYVQTVEYNKIFDKEQASYLKREFQQKSFIMPNE